MDTRFALQITDNTTFLAQYERKGTSWTRTGLQSAATPFCALPKTASDLLPTAERITTFVKQNHPAGIGCRLIIPANWCFIQHVEAPAGRFNDAAAQYAFEQYIPVELEQLTCCNERLDGSTVRITAVFTAAMNALLRTLEDAQVAVESLTVDAMLAGNLPGALQQTHTSFHVLMDDQRLAIRTVAQDDGVSLMRCFGVPQDADAELVRRQLILSPPLTAPENGCCHLWRLTDTRPADCVADALASLGVQVDTHDQESAIEQCLRAAVGSDGLPDLRVQTLTRQDRWNPLRNRLLGCAAAAAVLLATFAIRLCADNAVYSSVIDTSLRDQTRIYQDVHPDKPVPYGAALRLQSERIGLEATTAGPTDTPATAWLHRSGLDAFTTLHEVTSRIPSGLKLYVNEIQLDDVGITLSGQTTSHGAAGDIVRELNELTTLSVDPPRTKRRQDKTVDFRIRAVRTEDNTHD